MRYNLLLIGVMIASLPFGINACDVCGCGANGTSWGIMPRQNSHFIGLRTQYRLFSNTHPPVTDEVFALGGEDKYLRMDISGRYVWSKRFQTLVALPYVMNVHTEDGVKTDFTGIGDISTIAQFMLIQPGCKVFSHALQISAGVKMPTGKFTFSHELPSTSQTGTGSWDYLTGINYTIRRYEVGMNLEAWHQFNGDTKDGFGWGDRTTVNMRLFYAIETDSLTTILPWIGFSGEHFDSNIENTKYNIRAAYSGGEMYNAIGGLDLFTQRFTCGLELGLPLGGNISDGYSRMKYHVGARFLFFIQNKKINKPLK
jgi:hypothetical protein